VRFEAVAFLLADHFIGADDGVREWRGSGTSLA
jgi:hypothetical protein